MALPPVPLRGKGYNFLPVVAKNINKNIIRPDDNKATPAKMYMDKADFTLTSRNVLFGYQFKSIAGLAFCLQNCQESAILDVK